MPSKGTDHAVDRAAHALRRRNVGKPSAEDAEQVRRAATFPGPRPRALPGQLDLDGQIHEGPPRAA
jgi:hypothetical protein